MKLLVSLPLIFIWGLFAWFSQVFVYKSELLVKNPKAKPQLSRKRLVFYMSFLAILAIAFILLVEYCLEILFQIELAAIALFMFFGVMSGAIGGKRRR